MIGTRKLDRLLRHADRADAKVVLVGDHHQLPAIEAGGIFAALAEPDAIHLTENRRKRDPSNASPRRTPSGPGRAAIEARRTRPVIETPPKPPPSTDGRTMARPHPRRRSAIMLAVHPRDVTALNEPPAPPSSPNGRRTRPVHIDGPFRGRGLVMTLHNDYRLGLINGQRGTITPIDPHGSLVRFDDDHRHDDPGRVSRRRPRSRVRDDRAQSPRPHLRPVFVLGDDLYPKPATPRSPAAATKTVSTSPSTTNPSVHHHGSLEPDEPIESVRRALWRSERQADHHTTRPRSTDVPVPSPYDRPAGAGHTRTGRPRDRRRHRPRLVESSCTSLVARLTRADDPRVSSVAPLPPCRQFCAVLQPIGGSAQLSSFGHDRQH